MTGLVGRVRAALTNRSELHGGVTVPADLLREVAEALDAAQRALPWIGVEQIRDRLNKALM